MSDEQAEVRKNVEKKRFEVLLGDGEVATLTYAESGDVIALIHTLVPQAHEGKGIASTMARTALEYAKANNLRVAPFCPYVATYIQRHPEYQPLAIDLGAH